MASDPLKQVRKRLGERLRRMREERSLTQSQVAKAAGVTQGMVSQVEKGSRELSIASVERLANAYQVDANLFIHNTNVREVVDAIGDAWESYTEIREQLIELSKAVKSTASFLENYKGQFVDALASSLGKDAFDVRFLDEGLLTQLREHVADGRDLPVSTHHPKYSAIGRVALQDRGYHEALMAHLLECEELSGPDFEYVRATARWLRIRHEDQLKKLRTKDLP